MKTLKILLVVSGALILLTLGAGCERKVINEAGDDYASLNSCFTCHGDEDGSLLAAKGEWLNSVHASGNNVDYTNRGGGYDCTGCHDHQGFLDFVETGEIDPPYDRVSSIHCFTCHAPHSRGDLSLRETGAYTLANEDTYNHGPSNLCVNCHHSRASVDDITDDFEITSSYFGPHHGPQGDLLIASNGYEFEGYEYENTGHANIFDNTGCIGCHMGNPQTHIGYKIGGHSFNMRDTESGTTLVGVCAECHPDAEEADDFDFEDTQKDVALKLNQLKNLLVAAKIATSSGDAVKGTYADADLVGAFWNYKMIAEDRSYGIHNPDYIMDLLESSIEYMESLSGKKLFVGGSANTDLNLISTH